jgi:iron complex outermembrane receptor protein
VETTRRTIERPRSWRQPPRGYARACSSLCVVAALVGGLVGSAGAHARAPEPEVLEPITPPVVLERREAIDPEPAREGGDVSVELLVTIGESGSVDDVTVQRSGGAVFDEAAIAAVRSWRFAPARRGDTPIASRIAVAIDFPAPSPAAPTPVTPEPVTPEPPPDAGEPSAPSEPTPPAADPTTPPAEAPIDVTVHGERELRATDRGASHFRLERDVLDAAPRQEGAEVLRAAPGVYIARSEGLAVAHRYVLRGFDADHGQDIEMKVGGLPVNLPSHLHGQGYADLGFLIGETVSAIDVTEGVTDPRQGDFAVAGTFDIHLGVPDRGWHVSSSYGRFGTLRELVRWAPNGQPDATFGAVQYSRTAGFGDGRAGQAASGIVQAELGRPDARWGHRVLALLYGARADSAGVVRRDDVESGEVDWYGVYPFPTAEAQNAQAGRIMAGYFAEYRGAKKDNAELSVWLGFDDFRSQSNFTGFTQRSQVLPDVAGRGDLIEQLNRTTSAGLSGRYRTRPYRPAKWAEGTVELGMVGRFDNIVQAQNLLDASVRNQTWDRRVDATVRGADLGMYGDLDWRFTSYLRARAGVRADVLYYNIEDALGNFAPAVRPQDAYIPGFRRGAFGVAWGPRTSVEVLPLDWLSIRAAYGEGYRSPQARLLEDGERAPFTKVRSADLGVRWGTGERWQVTTAGFYTHLSDDVAFDAEEGRLERIGASQRLGAVVHAQARPVEWIVAAVSATYVDAELLEPPPATAEEPQPAFERGQNLPYVPPVVLRADLGTQGTLARRARPWPLTGRAGVGFSYLSPRPLPYGAFAEHLPLLDASAGLGYGPFDFGASFFNVLDHRYAAVEYNFASDWDPDGLRSRTPARHIAAGAPFSFMFTLGVSL